MLIRNYGLFWRRSVIAPDGAWPRSGELLGLGVKKKKQKFVDFANQRGVYALYDDNFRLIYVGQAGRAKRRLYSRLRAHTIGNLADRWSRFSWFGLMGVGPEPNSDGHFELEDVPDEIPTDRTSILNHVEAVLIMAAEPMRNTKGGIFGKEVTHYRQTARGAPPPEDELDEDDLE
ncbi:MAG TPA: GIY-YIG nuclease family protein [Microvirga sp.]|jgi:hypothetical protein|nr:GIY-YIG nuclease family protein [Microvirga sp.]